MHTVLTFWPNLGTGFAKEGVPPQIPPPHGLPSYTFETRGVCHVVALPFTFKRSILRKKEEFMEIQIFRHSKTI
jgi:hypothetical protein